MNARDFFRIYVIPGAVFEAITVGGGYGTGREIVQFFTQYGPTGGLLGLLVATCGMTFIFSKPDRPGLDLIRASRGHDAVARAGRDRGCGG
jgi:hypothetical protein